MLNNDEVTDVGLGTWVLGEFMWKGDTEPFETIETALDGGINLIDTAPVYGKGRSEELVGEALNKSGVREDVFLATKCGLEWEGDAVWRNSRPERLRREIKDSLERLDVDTIDLYQIHWPDHDVPFAESVDLLEEFRDEGLIRYIGLSNYDVDEIKQAQNGGTIDFLQPPYNLFERKAEESILPFCEDQDIDTLVYGALCRGLLTGKYENPGDVELEDGDIRNNDPKFTNRKNDYIEAVNEIKNFLRNRGHDEQLAALMLRWTAEQPGVTTALVGARNPEQARSNAKALGVSLSGDEIDRIRDIADDVIEDPVGPEFMAPPEAA
jgi:aryl-alcohol dehydrogenase-like predicted oxidoreductase